MIHLTERGGSALHLASAQGIPLDVLREWRLTRRDNESATALALRDDTAVWLSRADARIGFLTIGTGMAAVPLPGPASAPPAGVLSVVTTAPGAPTASQWSLLTAVARWLSVRLWQPAPAVREEPNARQRLAQAAAAAPAGTWDWDLRTGDVVGDPALLGVLGIDPRTFDGTVESWAATVHPDDVERVMTDVAEALHTRDDYTAEYRIRHPDGAVRWARVHGHVTLGDDGVPVRLGGTVWDATARTSSTETIAHVLRHLRDAFLTTDPDWRITHMNVQAESLLGSSRTLLGRRLWDTPAVQATGLEPRLRLAADRGTHDDIDLLWPTDQRWYRIRLTPSPDGPAIQFTDVTERRLLDAEHQAAERAVAERSTRIDLLTAALARAVTVRDVVDAVAALVLPAFGAAGLVVQVVEGEYLRLVEAKGYPPEFLQRMQRLPLSDRNPNADAFRSRAPVFLTSQPHFARHYPDYADHASRFGKQAWAFLPLIVRGQPVGCCVLSFSRPRRFSEEERTLLTALSQTIAQNLERARLYDAEHQRAAELQRGLLPRALPALPAVTTAARYLPAGPGTAVGGDWYDVIPLSADRVALIIGDVVGHGLTEAVAMGRLRTAVQTLAGFELPPDELFAQLNDLVSAIGDDFYATCLCVLYDPTTQGCTLVSAGHPPPALVRPDGTVEFPRVEPNPPLGAATPPFETTEMDLPGGSVLVLYTDGLVESAVTDMGSGMRRLADTLTAAYRSGAAVPPDGRAAEGGPPGAEPGDAQWLDRLCDSLTTTLVPDPETINDDVALLVVRAHAAASASVASWLLSDGPVAAGEARRHVRRQLADWHLDDLVMTTELVVSELVGNVIRHARGPIRLRLLHSRCLTCEVSDSSLTTPRIRRARDTDEGGRGLQLVAALSQRWGTRYTTDGKCIWTEQALPRAG
ncbi:SpoIIE family protein phosphatase [Streptomyces sp. NPDC048179]|uniref:SpoIIE family protein phosphatase n=1 Tax=Streptomyces sp. NPDC048179 TaxID=3365506 RepID=UPI0037147EFF